MKIHYRVVVVLTVMLTAVAVFTAADKTAAIELDKGAALRQNVLLFRWPSGIGKPFITERNFGISETRSRLWAAAYHGETALNIAFETRANFNSSIPGAFGVFGSEGSLLGQSSPLEHWDLKKDHISGTTTSMTTRIDRLDIAWRMGAFDIDVGRQPVTLGTSHFVGVLDIVAPFAPGDLDATYKPGGDAVRVRKGIGKTGEAEFIAAGSKEWEDGAFLGRIRSSFRKIDIEFVGGRFRRRTFGGIGWEGGTNPFGLWGEIALFERRKANEVWRGGWSKAAFSGVAGLDYYFTADFVVGGALMFQDFGVRDPKDLISVYSDAPYKEGWVFLGSASYGVVTVSRELHPLVQADAAGIINLIDSSTLWQPRLTISTGDNTDLSLYGWITTGEKPEVKGFSVSTPSEFGMMPDGGGFYARWFF